MKTAMIMLVAILLTFICEFKCYAAEELYLIDLRETPGKILEVRDVSWRPTPVLRPVFQRSGDGISVMAVHKYSPPCFVDLSRHNIFTTNGLTEERIFTFGEAIQDLAYDSRGSLFFSTVANGKGRIYSFNRHNRETRIYVEFDIADIASMTRGFWNGYFALDENNKIYLSIDAPQPGGSAIYEYRGGGLIEKFRHREKIAGFTFADGQTIYFANAGNRVYELRRFVEVAVKYDANSGRILNDVAFSEVPDAGNCAISGQLQGGQALWGQTIVKILGPNVMWRNVANSAISADRHGSYRFTGLPNGRYRVSTDLRGDSMAGFTPAYRMLNCGSSLNNINFRFSR